MLQVFKGFYETHPLWKHQQFGLQQFEFPDLEINQLPSLQLPSNLRLGHQMELVFQHYINSSSSYELIANNITVEEGKIRVGELDFIIKEKRKHRYLHVELAYKFYIINPEISEPIYRLMGPNKRDMFYTKMDKLKDKQFPLLNHPNLFPIWDTHQINPNKIQQECCFKAQLFQPYGERVSIRTLNLECIMGSWIRFDDFNSKEFQTAHYYIPRKLEWVITPHEDVPWMSHFETLLEVNIRMVKENAPMLWVKKPEGRLEKLFVVWW